MIGGCHSMQKYLPCLTSVALGFLLLGVTCAAAEPRSFDVLLLNGTIYAGTRSAPAQGGRATAAELETMRNLADKALRDGVWGMSTGLIYVPGSYAQTDELAEIAKVVARHGGFYASHIRDEGKGLLGAIDEALTIGKSSGAR